MLLDARVMKKSSEMLDCLTKLILIEFFSNSSLLKSNPIAEKTVAFINANCHTAITEKQISEKIGYNADYLNRVFKSNFSKSIKQYIDEKRMEFIKNFMLYDNLTLKEIAAKSGFSEYKYFLKFFKYHEKITPSEFYKQYAKIYINS